MSELEMTPGEERPLSAEEIADLEAEAARASVHPEDAFRREDIAFDPVVRRVDGDFDAAALVAALRAQPELADFVDDCGNIQAAVRIDATADGEGFWVSVPETVPEAAVARAVAAYTAPAQEEPQTPIHDAIAEIRASVVNANSLDEMKASMAVALDVLMGAVGAQGDRHA